MGQDRSFSCSVHLSSLDDALSFLAANDQEPLLQYLNHLPPARQNRLVASLAGIDLNEFRRMRDVVLQGSDMALDLSLIEPVPVISRDSLGEYESVGEEILRQGKCAALTVAGGLGSRLGFDGPKGCFSIMPLSGKSLFAVFAERIQRYGERFGFAPYWFIMTSDATHQQTQDFFETHKFWGLDPQKVFFFRQGCFPVFDRAGHLLLATEDRICFAPNGHGGVFEALAEAGLVSLMREKGIEYVSYFQVDNPLVRIFDARFLGYHLAEQAEISAKVIWKRGPDENVGVFARVSGRTTVIEYSDLPDSLSQARDQAGQLLYGAGNPAIHILNRTFIEKICSQCGILPLHRAIRKQQYFDPQRGEVVIPETENACKLERFIFDAFPLAEKVCLVGISRENEFAPLKRAHGPDSIAACRQALLAYFARIWEKGAGSPVPRDEDGNILVRLEISPRLVADEDDLANMKRYAHHQLKPGETLECR